MNFVDVSQVTNGGLAKYDEDRNGTFLLAALLTFLVGELGLAGSQRGAEKQKPAARARIAPTASCELSGAAGNDLLYCNFIPSLQLTSAAPNFGRQGFAFPKGKTAGAKLGRGQEAIHLHFVLLETPCCAMYRASLGTRGETRRAAAEAETALVGRVSRWKRVVKPAALAPHVIIEQWERGERPPPSPRAPTTPPAPTAQEKPPAAQSADAVMADVAPAAEPAAADEPEILPAAAAAAAGAAAAGVSDITVAGVDAAVADEAAADPSSVDPSSVDRSTAEPEGPSGTVSREGTAPDSVALSAAAATPDVQMDVGQEEMGVPGEQMGALDDAMGVPPEGLAEEKIGSADNVSPDVMGAPPAPNGVEEPTGTPVADVVAQPADVAVAAQDPLGLVPPADGPADVPSDVPIDIANDVPGEIPADVAVDMSPEGSGDDIVTTVPAALPAALPTGPALNDGAEMELDNTAEAAVAMDFQGEIAPLPSINDVVNPPDMAAIPAELPSMPAELPSIPAELPSVGDLVNPAAIATEASELPSLPSMDEGNLPDMNAMAPEATAPADPTDPTNPADPLDPDALGQ